MIELFVKAALYQQVLGEIRLIAESKVYDEPTKLKAIEALARGVLQAFKAEAA